MIPTSMRALLATEYAGLGAVRMAEVPVPSPREGEVLIRTAAAALNFLDLLMLAGRYQVKPPLPFIPGRDVAGEVVAVGPGVGGFAVGQRVAAQPSFGAFAEYVAAPDFSCQRVPPGVSEAQAAAAATVLATVVAAMKLRARLTPGQRVLVTGAAGGVGMAAIQYARHLGAEAVGLVSSAAKAEAVRGLGAVAAVRSDLLGADKGALREALRAQGIESVDAVIDMVGGPLAEAMLRCLRPGGRYVIVGFAAGEIPRLPANYLLLKDIEVYGSSLTRLFGTRDPALLAGLTEAFGLLGAGSIEMKLDRVLPFAEFAAGARRLERREAVGKVVLQGF